MVEMRIAVRVKPGSSRAKVGGSYGEDSRLIVAVNAPAVDGAANEALLSALAKALGVRTREVTLVSGHASRSKLVAVTLMDNEIERVRTRLRELLEA